MAEGEETEKPEGEEAEEGEEGKEGEEEGPKFEDVFKKFATHGSPESKDDSITLANIDKWLKQAGVITLTAAETARAFKEVAKNKFALSPEEFDEFLETVTKGKELDPEKVKKDLTNSGSPVTSPTPSEEDALAREKLRCKPPPCLPPPCKPPPPPQLFDRCGLPIIIPEPPPKPTPKEPPEDKDKDKDKKSESASKEKKDTESKEKEEPAAE